MFINKNVKYREILMFALIGIIGYKIIDNYEYFFSILKKGLSILTPFIYAFICAYILNPVVKCIEKNFKIKRGLSIGITYLILLGVVFVTLFFTIPSLIDSIINITSEIPSYILKVQQWINISLKNERVRELITQAGLLNNLQDIAAQVGNISISILQDTLVYLVSLTSNLVNLVLGFLISIYVLNEKNSIIKGCKTVTYMILKEKSGSNLIEFVKTYNNMIGVYVGIKAIDSIIIGLIALVGLLVLGVSYSPLLALVVAITNMIPYFGPLVGIIICAAVTIFSSPIKALMVIMLLLVIQQFDAWYLEPKLIGKKVGVSPLGIIFGVTLCGGIMGPVGMILGSPTMATLRIYYSKLVKSFKEKNQELVKKKDLED